MYRKIALSLLALAITGCAGAQVKRDAILERSADRAPEWELKHTFERDGNLFVVGEGTDIEGYSLAQRMAKAAAARNVAEATGLKVKSELAQSAQRVGLAPSGSFIQDTVAMVTETITLQEFTHEADYREKVSRAEDDAIRYRVVSLYKLPLTQFKAAKARALEAMQGRAVRLQDRKAEAEAKRLLEELRGQ